MQHGDGIDKLITIFELKSKEHPRSKQIETKMDNVLKIYRSLPFGNYTHFPSRETLSAQEMM